jgi:gas vesicle protein
MDNNKSKVLLSLLAGATAGVVAGLLLAPDSGKNSRANLKSSASKLGGDIDKVFRDGLGRLQEMTGKLNSLVGQSVASTTEKVSSAADEMFEDFTAEAKSASGKAGNSPS